MSGWIVVPQAQASAFRRLRVNGRHLLWQRERDRKDMTDGGKNIKLTFLMRLELQHGFSGLATLRTNVRSGYRGVLPRLKWRKRRQRSSRAIAFSKNKG